MKMEKNMLREIDEKLKDHRYSTRTEFFRDIAREKLTEWQKAEMLEAIKKLRGWSKLKTTDEDLRRVREQLTEEDIVKSEKEFDEFVRSMNAR